MAAVSGRDGRTVEVYRYDVFGRTAIYDGAGRQQRPVSAVGNPYFFTGRRLDFETGLYYYRARMYSPNLGRFMQTDPVGYSDGINWYAYCGNNPVSWIDPWGLCAKGSDEPLFVLRESYEGRGDSAGDWVFNPNRCEDGIYYLTDQDLIDEVDWTLQNNLESSPGTDDGRFKYFEKEHGGLRAFSYKGKLFKAEEMNYVSFGAYTYARFGLAAAAVGPVLIDFAYDHIPYARGDLFDWYKRSTLRPMLNPYHIYGQLGEVHMNAVGIGYAREQLKNK